MEPQTPLEYVPDGCETKHAPMPHHLRGLTWTRTGYGPKIPTTTMLRLPGDKHWRRVYCMIWGNSGTRYVLVQGRTVIIPG